MNDGLLYVAFLPERKDLCHENKSRPKSQQRSELGVDENWIERRCGIRSRFLAKEETTRTLGVAAARKAIGMALDIRPDLVICGTFTPEYFPCPTAPAIAHDLGLPMPGAIDLNAACAGGITGILTSLSLLFAGAARTVLLVSADTTTRFLARRDTQTLILFGDGAAAFVLWFSRAVMHVWFRRRGRTPLSP